MHVQRIPFGASNINKCKDCIKINSTSPIVVKLHGDFRYDLLKNTDDETQLLHQSVMNELTHLFDSLGLIVVGYSGRDESVMSFLENFVKNENETRAFPNGFYWCIREGEVEKQRIKTLIDKLREKGIETDFVKITSFDDFLIGIYNQIGKNDNEIDEWLSLYSHQPFWNFINKLEGSWVASFIAASLVFFISWFTLKVVIPGVAKPLSLVFPKAIAEISKTGKETFFTYQKVSLFREMKEKRFCIAFSLLLIPVFRRK